jgi:apolipoprotein N-acyltransferase
LIEIYSKQFSGKLSGDFCLTVAKSLPRKHSLCAIDVEIRVRANSIAQRFFAKLVKMKISALKNIFPSIPNALLALLSAILLILSFPNFEFGFVAFFGLIPLFIAIEREKQFWRKSFFLGWIFGTVFFYGTCWWLTFAPITYAGFPPVLAYVLMLGVALVAGVFPAIFATLFSVLLKQFGIRAIPAAPFLWIFTEFLRFWATGNNWNAIGYSQAFSLSRRTIQAITVGGVFLAGFEILILNCFVFSLVRIALKPKLPKSVKKYVIYISPFVYFAPFVTLFFLILDRRIWRLFRRRSFRKLSPKLFAPFLFFLFLSIFVALAGFQGDRYDSDFQRDNKTAFVVAVQPNVPMSGIKYEDWINLRERHTRLAESALDANVSKFVEKAIKYSETPEKDKKIYEELFRNQFQNNPKVIIFPESPMIFLYSEDEEFREFIKNFAARNNAYVLFNAAEPDGKTKHNFNSAVMINPKGEKIAQYDKIHLLPFGEFTPLPDFLANEIPAFVGSFSFGNEFDLIPFGEAKGGVMICFESHFGSLSREYALRGADFLIEMTNDGYLGNTPVLRQHLANSVFRAVETNRPLVRVTNVGITAYINEHGEVLDAADVYTEAARVWTVSKSDGSQTFYVKYGDWFAWLCSIVSLALLFLSYFKRKPQLNTNNL